MKRILPAIIILPILLMASCQSTINDLKSKFKKDRISLPDSLWDQASDLERQGLYRSAESLYDSIQGLAVRMEKHPEALRALIGKWKNAQCYREEVDLDFLQELHETTRSKEGWARSLYSAYLAEYLMYYYRANQQEIPELIGMEGNRPGKIDDWSAGDFREAIQLHLNESIYPVDSLVKVRAGELESIVESDTSISNSRDNLFELLAWKTIPLWQSYASELSSPPPAIEEKTLLLPPEEFMFPTDSGLLGALSSLEEYYQQRGDSRGLAELYLHRMQNTVYSIYPSVSDSLLEQAFRNYRQRMEDIPEKAEFVAAEVRLLINRVGMHNSQGTSSRGDTLLKTAELCRDMIGRFPNTKGAYLCNQQLERITNEEISVTGNNGVLPGEPMLLAMQYRNLSNATVEIIRIPYELIGKPNEELLSYLENSKADNRVLSKVIELPNSGDHFAHGFEFDMKAPAPGAYAVRIDSDREVSSLHPLVFQSTQIACLQQSDGNGGTRLLTVDRRSGQPLDSAVCKLARMDSYHDGFKEENVVETVITDKNGEAQFGALNHRRGRLALMVEHEDSRLIDIPVRIHHPRNDNRISDRTQVFTDRGLYRPGQLVQFKAITWQNIPENQGRNEVIAGKKLNVVAKDGNGNVFFEKDMTTDEFGAVYSSFILPESLLPGGVSLQVGDAYHSIRVEEYKRPSFEVELESPAETYMIGDTIRISGKATTLSNLPVSNAKVRITAERGQGWLPWEFSPRGSFYGSFEQYWSGQVNTNEEGGFQIEIPLEDLRGEKRPVIQFRINAEITDNAGETQSSSKNLSAGRQPFFVNTRHPQIGVLDSLESIMVEMKNSAGEPVTGNIIATLTSLESPERPIRQRKWNIPGEYAGGVDEFKRKFPFEAFQDEWNPLKWAVGDTLMDESIAISAETQMELPDLEPGYYRLIVDASDRSDYEVRDSSWFAVVDPSSEKVALNEAVNIVPLRDKVEPGEDARFLISSNARTKVAMRLERDGAIDSTRTFDLDNEQRIVSVPVYESDRGGFAVYFLSVWENREYVQTRNIEVPWTSKKLEVQWESFRDKTEPGSEESWSVAISQSDSTIKNVQFLAGMYDAALDEIMPYNVNFNPYFSYRARLGMNTSAGFDFGRAVIHSKQQRDYDFTTEQPNRLIDFGGETPCYWPFLSGRGGNIRYRTSYAMNEVADAEGMAQPAKSEADGQQQPAEKALRADFSETAFFYPDLQADSTGQVSWRFTMPESVTRWKVFGVAHTRDLKVGTIEAESITQRKLMIEPNLPRTLRVGDTLTVGALIRRSIDENIAGYTSMLLFDPVSGKEVTDEWLLGDRQKQFQLYRVEQVTKEWRLKVPSGVSMVRVELYADAGEHVDGEAHLLPVLDNRITLTESMPIPVGPGEKVEMSFGKFSGSMNENPDRTLGYTFEYTARPTWYVVQALPAIFETDFNSSEKVFSSYYAACMGESVVKSNPRISDMINLWARSDADEFTSKLEENPEVKSIVLRETPWMLEAKTERENKRRLAVFLDENRLLQARRSALSKLAQMQQGNGGLSWFPGGTPNLFMTQYVLEGLVKLRSLELLPESDNQQVSTIIEKALSFSLSEMKKRYERRYTAKDSMADILSPLDIQLLYILSMHQGAQEVSGDLAAVVSHYRELQAKFWTKKSLMMQAMIALDAHRSNRPQLTENILASLNERALTDEELGMYWKELHSGLYWHEAPIETQAMLIELYDEVANDQDAVFKMKTWLLKQKQTQTWSNSKATVNACFAMLERGSNWLEESPNPDIRIGGQPVDFSGNAGNDPFNVDPELGTGYFKLSWAGTELNSGLGEITIKSNSNSPSWGAAYWTYSQPISEIESSGKGLSVSKKLFVERQGDDRALEPLNKGAKLEPGDKIIVRIEVIVDRNMEFVHLKDYRASGTEPTQMLSGYRYSGGISYYQTPRDEATHFFIDYLSKGSYTLEYSLYAAQKGNFEAGSALIECMYAPEFRGHSSSDKIEIH